MAHHPELQVGSQAALPLAATEDARPHHQEEVEEEVVIWGNMGLAVGLQQVQGRTVLDSVVEERVRHEGDRHHRLSEEGGYTD
jgi:hypothetical protein